MTPKEAGGKKQDNSKKEDEVKGTEVEDESHEAMKEETEVEDEDKGRRRVSEQAGPSMQRGIKERRGSEQAGPSLQEGVPKEDPSRGNLRDERDEDLLGNDPANVEIQDGKEAGNPSSSNHVEDFEVRKHRTANKPILPTKSEIEEHFPLHLQYRSWCPHCVAGKARSNPHARRDDSSESMGVTWHADYAFMGGEYNEEEDGMQASLIMYDDNKDSVWAVGVDSKGASDAMIKYGVGNIEQSGYSGEKITFKTDQEPSLIALKAAISASRMGETVPIESPVRASKSNGRMENSVKIWQGQIRTIKHFVESKIGGRIEPGGALFSWLIPFCADIVNKFRVGNDGRTAYERITAHKCKVAQVGFGEVVDFKVETDKNNRLKADSEFSVGVFLGYSWRSTEYLVASEDMIYKCRTIRRRADEVAYDPKMIGAVIARFEDFVLKGAKTTLKVSFPKAPAVQEKQPTRDATIVPRRIYLKPDDFRKHGFTQGCPGCIFAQTSVGPKRNHSEACRNRMEAEIAKDPTDMRMTKANERIDHYMEQQLMKSDAENKREIDPRHGGAESNVDDKREADPRHGGEREPNVTDTEADKEAEDEDKIAELFMDDQLDIDLLEAKNEDAHIFYHAILGHDLTECYSNKRLQLAGDRHIVGQIASADVTEIFSPERVSKLCSQYGPKPGQAMDIKNGYDFDLAEDRRRAWEIIKKSKPTIVIGSPPCTFFSRLQELNKHMYRNDANWMAKFGEGMEQAKRHIRFCISIYKHQINNGGYLNIRGSPLAGTCLKVRKWQTWLERKRFEQTCVSLA